MILIVRLFIDGLRKVVIPTCPFPPDDSSVGPSPKDRDLTDRKNSDYRPPPQKILRQGIPQLRALIFQKSALHDFRL